MSLKKGAIRSRFEALKKAMETESGGFLGNLFEPEGWEFDEKIIPQLTRVAKNILNLDIDLADLPIIKDLSQLIRAEEGLEKVSFIASFTDYLATKTPQIKEIASDTEF